MNIFLKRYFGQNSQFTRFNVKMSQVQWWTKVLKCFQNSLHVASQSQIYLQVLLKRVPCFLLFHEKTTWSPGKVEKWSERPDFMPNPESVPMLINSMRKQACNGLENSLHHRWPKLIVDLFLKSVFLGSLARVLHVATTGMGLQTWPVNEFDQQNTIQ